MKNIYDSIVMTCAVAASLLVVAGCGMDTVELGEYVRKEMQSELAKVDGLKSLQMQEVRLLKDGGVNYSGVGKGEIEGRSIKFHVKCKYDGKTVVWDASPADDNMFALATKEKIREICKNIKEGLRKTCDSASKKADEFCERAAKETEKCIDSVKEKVTSE